MNQARCFDLPTSLRNLDNICTRRSQAPFTWCVRALRVLICPQCLEDCSTELLIPSPFRRCGCHPFPEVTGMCCRLPSPTTSSLRTRSCQTWRPNAVPCTIRVQVNQYFGFFKSICWLIGHFECMTSCSTSRCVFPRPD